MWAPQRVSLLAGLIAGGISLLAMPSAIDMCVVALAMVAALQVSLLTFLGLWLSRRSVLRSGIAVALVASIACVAFMETWPIRTHATLVGMPSSASAANSISWVGWSGIGFFALPAALGLVAGLAFGVPPNKALERTRAR